MRWIVLGCCLALAAGSVQAAETVSAELIRLHDDLKLSEAQETAWTRYATAIAPDPQAIARRRATQALLPTVPTPRRIALIEAAMAQDVLDFKRQGAAVTAFYASLSPQQQQVFDQDTLPATSAPP